MISASVHGLDLADRLRVQGLTVEQRVDAVVGVHRQAIASAASAGAPRGATGQFAGSFVVDGDEVGSNAPQAHRLEVGFHGADSLGRVYDQDGDPTLGPAFDVTAPVLTRSLEQLVDQIDRAL